MHSVISVFSQKHFFPSSRYCKNVVDNTYNVRNMCEATTSSVQLLDNSRPSVKFHGSQK